MEARCKLQYQAGDVIGRTDIIEASGQLYPLANPIPVMFD